MKKDAQDSAAMSWLSEEAHELFPVFQIGRTERILKIDHIFRFSAEWEVSKEVPWPLLRKS